VHEVPDKNIPEAVGYGVLDVGANEGWMSLGDDHDTAAFAVNAIGRWWQSVGSARYPDATRLQGSAHRGGSNGYRNRLWKRTLAALAAGTGLTITVCHYPPGTSKWNKIVIYTGFGGVYDVTDVPELSVAWTSPEGYLYRRRRCRP
jgi:hypothetical protein